MNAVIKRYGNLSCPGKNSATRAKVVAFKSCERGIDFSIIANGGESAVFGEINSHVSANP